VAHAVRQAVFAPALAAVLGAEYLTNARDGKDLVRVFRVQRDAHHRRIRLDAVVETLPGRADIVAAVDGAVGATGSGAQRRIHDLRVERRSADVAAVGQWRESADLHIGPMTALVGAAKEAHAVGEEYGAGRSGAARQR